MKMMKILVVIALILGLGVMPASADFNKYKKKVKCEDTFKIKSSGHVYQSFGWWKYFPARNAKVVLKAGPYFAGDTTDLLGFYKIVIKKAKVDKFNKKCKPFSYFKVPLELIAFNWFDKKIFKNQEFQKCCNPKTIEFNRDFFLKAKIFKPIKPPVAPNANS
jgi:hypothetical protein